MVDAGRRKAGKRVGIESWCYGEVWWERRMWMVGMVGEEVERGGSRGVFPLGVWRLLQTLLLLHSAAIKIQEAKDSIDEEDPRPTSSTWSYIRTSIN